MIMFVNWNSKNKKGDLLETKNDSLFVLELRFYRYQSFVSDLK